MDQIPIQVIVMPIVGLMVVVGMILWQKKMSRSTEQAYAGFRAGALAQRLRMQLLEGDANLNLMVPQLDPARQKNMRNGDVIEQRVRMAGAPTGHPSELTYFYRVRCESGLTETVFHTWFDSRISMQARVSFPDFEIASRTTSFGKIQLSLPLPPQSFGNAFIDQQYVLASSDSRVGGVVAGMMGAFSTLTVGGVHIVAQNGTLAFVMNETSHSSLIYHVETIITALEAMARALGSVP